MKLLLSLVAALVGVHAVDRISCKGTSTPPCETPTVHCGCNQYSTGVCSDDDLDFESCTGSGKTKIWDLLERDGGDGEYDFNSDGLCAVRKDDGQVFECSVSAHSVETFDGLRYDFDGGASGVYTLYDSSGKEPQSGNSVGALSLVTVQQIIQGAYKGYAFVFGGAAGSVVEVLYNAVADDLRLYQDYVELETEDRSLLALTDQPSGINFDTNGVSGTGEAERFTGAQGSGYLVSFDLTSTATISHVSMVFTAAAEGANVGGARIRLVSAPSSDEGFPDTNEDVDYWAKGLCGNGNGCANDDLVVWGTDRGDDSGIPQILCPNADSKKIGEIFAPTAVPPPMGGGAPKTVYDASSTPLKPAVFGHLFGLTLNQETDSWGSSQARGQPIPFNIPGYAVKKQTKDAGSKPYCAFLPTRKANSVLTTSLRDQCETGSVEDSFAAYTEFKQRCVAQCADPTKYGLTNALSDCDCVDVCTDNENDSRTGEGNSVSSVFGRWEWAFARVGDGKCTTVGSGLAAGSEVPAKSLAKTLADYEQQSSTSFTGGTTAFAYKDDNKVIPYTGTDWSNNFDADVADGTANYTCYRRQYHQFHVWGSPNARGETRVPEARLVTNRFDKSQASWAPAYGLGGKYKGQAAAVDLCEARVQDIDIELTCPGSAVDIPTSGPTEVQWNPLRYPLVGVEAELPQDWFQVFWSFVDWPNKNNTKWAGRNRSPAIHHQNSRAVYFYPERGTGDYTLRVQTTDGCSISSGTVTVKAACSGCNPSVQINPGTGNDLIRESGTATLKVRSPDHGARDTTALDLGIGEDQKFHDGAYDDEIYNPLAPGSTQDDSNSFEEDTKAMEYQWTLNKEGGVSEAGTWSAGDVGGTLSSTAFAFVDPTNTEAYEVNRADDAVSAATWVLSRETAAATSALNVPANEGPTEWVITDRDTSACGDLPASTQAAITGYLDNSGLSGDQPDEGGVHFSDGSQTTPSTGGESELLQQTTTPECQKWMRRAITAGTFNVQPQDGSFTISDVRQELNPDGSGDAGVSSSIFGAPSHDVFTAQRIHVDRFTQVSQERTKSVDYEAVTGPTSSETDPFKCTIAGATLNTATSAFTFTSAISSESKYQSTWFDKNFGERGCLGVFTASVEVDDEFGCNSGAASHPINVECEEPPRPRLGAPSKVSYDYAERRFNWMTFDTRGSADKDGVRDSSGDPVYETLFLKSQPGGDTIPTSGFFANDEESVQTGGHTQDAEGNNIGLRTNLFQSGSNQRIFCTSDDIFDTRATLDNSVAQHCGNAASGSDQAAQMFTADGGFRIGFRPHAAGDYTMGYLLSDGCAYAVAETTSTAECLGVVANGVTEYVSEARYDTNDWQGSLDPSDAPAAISLNDTPPRCYYDSAYRGAHLHQCALAITWASRTASDTTFTTFAGNDRQEPVYHTYFADSPGLTSDRGGKLTIKWEVNIDQSQTPGADREVCNALLVNSGITWHDTASRSACKALAVGIRVVPHGASQTSQAGNQIERDFEDWRKLNIVQNDPAVLDGSFGTRQIDLWSYEYARFEITPHWAEATTTTSYKIKKTTTDGCAAALEVTETLGPFSCPALELAAFQASADDTLTPLTDTSGTPTVLEANNAYSLTYDDSADDVKTNGIHLRVAHQFGLNGATPAVPYLNAVWNDDQDTDVFWFLTGVVGDTTPLAKLFNAHNTTDGELPLAKHLNGVYTDVLATYWDTNDVANAFVGLSVPALSGLVADKATSRVEPYAGSNGEVVAININKDMFLNSRQGDQYEFKVIARRGCSWSPAQTITATLQTPADTQIFCPTIKFTVDETTSFLTKETSQEVKGTSTAFTLGSGGPSGQAPVATLTFGAFALDDDNSRFKTTGFTTVTGTDRGTTYNAASSSGFIKWTGYTGANSDSATVSTPWHTSPGITLDTTAGDTTGFVQFSASNTLNFQRSGTYTFTVYTKDVNQLELTSETLDEPNAHAPGPDSDIEAYITACADDSSYAAIRFTVEVLCSFPIASVYNADWFFYDRNLGYELSAANTGASVNVDYMASYLQNGNLTHSAASFSSDYLAHPKWDANSNGLLFTKRWFFSPESPTSGVELDYNDNDVADAYVLNAGLESELEFESSVKWWNNKKKGATDYTLVVDDKCNAPQTVQTKTVTTQCKASATNFAPPTSTATYSNGQFPLVFLDATGGLFGTRGFPNNDLELDPHTIYAANDGAGLGSVDWESMADNAIIDNPPTTGGDPVYELPNELNDAALDPVGGVFPNTDTDDNFFGGGPTRYYVEYVWRVLEAPTRTGHRFKSGSYGTPEDATIISEYDGKYVLDPSFTEADWKTPSKNTGSGNVEFNGDTASTEGFLLNATEPDTETTSGGIKTTTTMQMATVDTLQSTSWVELVSLRDDPDRWGRNSYYRGNAPAAFYPDLAGTYKLELEVRDGCIEQDGPLKFTHTVTATCPTLGSGIVAKELVVDHHDHGADDTTDSATHSEAATSSWATIALDGSNVPVTLSRTDSNMVILEARTSDTIYSDNTEYFWIISTPDQEATDDGRTVIDTREIEFSTEQLSTHRVTIRFGSHARGQYDVTLRRTDGCSLTTETFTITADCEAITEDTFIQEAKSQIVVPLTSGLGSLRPVRLTSDAECTAHVWWAGAAYEAGKAVFDKEAGLVGYQQPDSTPASSVTATVAVFAAALLAHLF